MAENPLEWTMGFRNRSSGKYLTQETFGFALNVSCKFPATPLCCCFLWILAPKVLLPEHFFFSLSSPFGAATSLKKKQIFTLLPADGGVYIKT